jgi:Zn-dependent protease with chaperone function
MPAGPIRARWFDGRSSHARPVLAVLAPGPGGPSLTLNLIAEERGAVTFASRDVGWPEAWSAKRAPRTVTVDLRDAGTLEVDDVAQWREAFAQAGGASALSERLQTRWTFLLGALVIAALGLAAFYRWGTPWAATQVTREVPLAWEDALAQRALSDLDASMLHPSKLSAERQARLRARFDALVHAMDPGLQRYRGYAPHLALQFRTGMPANAFALPGGTIVVTDAIVEEADQKQLGDDALAGVLAHEIGHVVHRHTTRMIVEQAVLNIGLGLALGDVSSFVSMTGSALTGLAYRRGHETEADCFAVALMRKANAPTAPMADLLLDLQSSRSGDAREPAFATLLSSHPATHERALMLKRGDDVCR